MWEEHLSEGVSGRGDVPAWGTEEVWHSYRMQSHCDERGQESLLDSFGLGRAEERTLVCDPTEEGASFPDCWGPLRLESWGPV